MIYERPAIETRAEADVGDARRQEAVDVSEIDDSGELIGPI
jgi:hypothetical protein